jgi:hypothetical protein
VARRFRWEVSGITRISWARRRAEAVADAQQHVDACTVEVARVAEVDDEGQGVGTKRSAELLLGDRGVRGVDIFAGYSYATGSQVFYGRDVFHLARRPLNEP